MQRQAIAGEALGDLRRRLQPLPPQSAERRWLMHETAARYGMSAATRSRVLRERGRPRALQRTDTGKPRVLPPAQTERDGEISAALKVRPSNLQGRHLSTAQAIRLLETFGVEPPAGVLQSPPDVLTIPTVNRSLKQWGDDQRTLTRQPPAGRFQAEHSNECWHGDLSPSDLKQVPHPRWEQEGRGRPVLRLYSVVAARSGVSYPEYHGVYGEDVEAAWRFLCPAMAPKTVAAFPLQGIPAMLSMDNGPIARSQVFQQGRRYLGIVVQTHMPRGKDGRRVTARSKGKGECPFRTVKAMHATLDHFHVPQNEDEANAGLCQCVLRDNTMHHRSEAHSRLDDWLLHLPEAGLRQMWTWERCCTFAREPERRQVGGDARVSVAGVSYEVAPAVAGETVILWWGVFDQALYIAHGDKRYGPYRPVGGPIPLPRYRRFKSTAYEKRADRIEALAAQLQIPRAAVDGSYPVLLPRAPSPPGQPFLDPDPFHEFTYPRVLKAKQAIADELLMPLAKLSQEQLTALDTVLAHTLRNSDVLAYVRLQRKPLIPGGERC